MIKKPVARPDFSEVTYDAKHWTLLSSYRNRAKQLMQALNKMHVETVAYGSIARGNVTDTSDVDIFVPHKIASFNVEFALENAGIRVNDRLLVQATPTYAMKAYIETDESSGVSFPLMDMRRVEREFYKFGGEITLESLQADQRVMGVDKRLMLIEPTKEGHLESSIVGREHHVAKLLGISAETVLNRVRTLLRRDEIGRTGVFVKQRLLPDETFEMALERLVEENPAVRRRACQRYE